MTTKTILIFHRSKNSCWEDLANQQAFLDLHKSELGCTEIFDYQSGNQATALRILETTIKKGIEGKTKLVVILNSHLSQKEHALEYDLYRFSSAMKTLGFASIYLMDSGGKLYQQVETIGDHTCRANNR